VQLLPIANAQELIRSVASLIGAIAWPAVIALLVLRFGPPMGRFFVSHGDSFFRRLDKVALEAAGVRISAEAATVDLTRAAVEASRTEASDEPVNVKEIAATVGRATEVTATRVAQILWVDDRPQNNVRERAAMLAIGMRVALAQSTDEALEALKANRFDVVISDMGRPPDPEAGYTLLTTMRERGDMTPFVIYAGSRAVAHKQLAQERGALGTTNRPQELLDLVLRAVEARG
jgi:PleD family two-component response regulator